MSVVAADLVYYGAANHQETDAGTPQGGAIDLTVRVVPNDAAEFNLTSGADTITVVSDNAGDTTQTVTVTGRLASGVIDTEALALNGTTPVVGAKTFERILKLVLDAAITGIVTVSETSGAATIVTYPASTAVRTFRRLFYDAAAEASGGSTKEYYEKVFIKNENATNALLGVTVKENADPETDISFALEDAVDDSGTSTNRITIPTASEIGASGFSSADKVLSTETDASTADLGAGEAIGVWVNATLPAGEPATKSTWTLEITGTTT